MRASALGAALLLFGSLEARGGEKVTVVPNPPTLHFSSLTTDDGLSQNSVLAILQDREGFLWLGTENGLNRYDGREFRRYTEGEGESSKPSGAFVLDLALSPGGEIWFAGQGTGVCRVDRTSGRVHCLTHRSGDSDALGSDLIIALAFDADGRLWVGTRTEGLLRLRPDGQTF